MLGAWLWVLAAVVCVSILVFIMAVVDKLRARAGRARIRERTLLTWAALGGSPGLLLGMLIARHKVRKGSFLAKLGIVLLLQAALLFFATR